MLRRARFFVRLILDAVGSARSFGRAIKIVHVLAGSDRWPIVTLRTRVAWIATVRARELRVVRTLRIHGRRGETLRLLDELVTGRLIVPRPTINHAAGSSRSPWGLS